MRDRSTGRTLGSEPGNRSSNLCPAAQKEEENGRNMFMLAHVLLPASEVA